MQPDITPPQISEERIAQLWDAMPKAWPFPSETRASRAAFAQAVAAEINRQWLERLEPVAWQVHGGRTFVDKPHSSRVGAELSAAERKDGATVSTLYRIKEQG